MSAQPDAVATPTAASPPTTSDAAQKLGLALLTVAMFLKRTGIGVLVIIAGWGVFVPAFILTLDFHVAVRVLLALAVFGGWIALIVSQA